jgi:hypothetical protein
VLPLAALVRRLRQIIVADKVSTCQCLWIVG